VRTKTMESQAIQIAFDILANDYNVNFRVYAIAQKAKKQLEVIREPKYLFFHVDTTIGEHRCLYPQCEKDLMQELNERLESDYKTVREFQQSPEYAQEYVILEVML